jgi:GT2 family glycosyltransferase
LVTNKDGSEQRGCRRDMLTPLLTLAHGLRLHKVFPRLEFNHTHRPLPQQVVEVPALSGACMLIQCAAHKHIGGFDEVFFFAL